jgi:quercetin dioxygenase-like cupin family protein
MREGRIFFENSLVTNFLKNFRDHLNQNLQKNNTLTCIFYQTSFLYNFIKTTSMKKIVILLIMFVPFLGISQNSQYVVTSFLQDGPKAPNMHYIGEAFLSSVLQGDSELNYNITKATFRKNSTLDWHKHPTVQVLIIIDGEGYYQEKGKDAIMIKKGDVIRCSKDIEHWHTASKENLVTYLALYDGSKPTIWTDKLTQEYYDSIAEKLKAEKK